MMVVRFGCVHSVCLFKEQNRALVKLLSIILCNSAVLSYTILCLYRHYCIKARVGYNKANMKAELMQKVWNENVIKNI